MLVRTPWDLEFSFHKLSPKFSLLVQLAMELCGAESAGISVLEPETAQFRWFALRGVLSVFEGATTPRNFSPCGVCLDENAPS